MKKTEILAYTAGIMDGEGCISLLRYPNRNKETVLTLLRVQITNTNEWLIKWLQMQFGGNINFYRVKEAQCKDRWNWYLSPKDSLVFLKLILPYLQIKRPQAELAIEFQSNRRHVAWGTPKGKNGGSSKSKESYILEEAQRILMGKYNKKGK